MRWGSGWMNPFTAARDDKSAMRPFAKLLLTLVIVAINRCKQGVALKGRNTTGPPRATSW